MKNFLYHFEFCSGLYENIFYKQIQEKDEKTAIEFIIAEFMDVDYDEAKIHIAKILGKNWTSDSFWKKYDRSIMTSDCSEAYYLISVDEINFDLSNIKSQNVFTT